MCSLNDIRDVVLHYRASGTEIPVLTWGKVVQSSANTRKSARPYELSAIRFAIMAVWLRVTSISHRHNSILRAINQAGDVSWTTTKIYFASGTITISCFRVRSRKSFALSYRTHQSVFPTRTSIKKPYLRIQALYKCLCSINVIPDHWSYLFRSLLFLRLIVLQCVRYCAITVCRCLRS